MNFKKVSIKLGFTETELKVSLILIAILLSALLVKYFYNNTNNENYINYDYSSEDSLFYSISSSSDKDPEQLIEYTETLDLNRSADYKKKSLPPEKSIDLNQADLNILMKLPGVGEKTAKAIIEIRNKKGKFSNINELLTVKGIGKTKLNKIKKFIYIK